ncbi:MAG: N-acetyl-gamma-glutamyl-phosphate reductase [Deltaproteobacteria bacterium]|nr:N-acetyl-gamma-glutamyl-phosphate reductase [Deltaproteobacteria bacterium]
MLRVAVLGASGYTGLELLRLLASHSMAEVSLVTSRQYAGKPVTEVFPFLRGFYDALTFKDPSEFSNTDAEFYFSCLPHGNAMEIVPDICGGERLVVDLSADFRLKDAELFKRWYEPHKAASLLKEAVYGLPEINRKKIKEARLVANPGCYPTASILAIAPLLKKGLVNRDSIIIDAKSGVSGAGRAATLDNSFVEVSGGFKPYKVGNHRHTPEIEQTMTELFGSEISVTFTPHLLPISRGILATVYAKLSAIISPSDLRDAYQEFYKDERFVRLCPEGTFPDVSRVRGSNFCDIGLWLDENKQSIIAVSAIDNLVKGASGQAIQNMNIMCGFKEREGLRGAPQSF